MSGGGKQPTHTTQTVTQNVPAFLKPYYTDVMSKSKALSEETYNPFGGQRLADDSVDLGTSQRMIRDIAGQPIAGLAEAQGTLGGLGSLAGQLGQQQPGQFNAAEFGQTGVSPYAGFQAGQVSPFSDFQATQATPFSDFQATQVTPFSDFQATQVTPFSDFQAMQATPFSGFQATQVTPFSDFQATQVTPFSDFQEFGGAQQFGYDPTGQFDTATAAQYMDPFMQTVVGRQQDDAIEKFRQQQAGRDASAVQAGAFGGSRQAVQQGIAETGLMNQLGDIQATGSQRAFEQAQQQFERDRAAGMTTEQRRAEEAARVQGIGVGETARVQTGEAGELGRVQGIDVSEQARVQGATADEAMRQREFQLQTMGFSADMAREVVGLAERARQGDIQAAQLLEAQGLGEMARGQARLDVGYEDFLRQQNFPRQQLADYSAILRGMPVADIGTQTTTAPGPSALQQALGAGISAVGLYKGMQ